MIRPRWLPAAAILSALSGVAVAAWLFTTLTT